MKAFPEGTYVYNNNILHRPNSSVVLTQAAEF